MQSGRWRGDASTSVLVALQQIMNRLNILEETLSKAQNELHDELNSICTTLHEHAVAAQDSDQQLASQQKELARDIATIPDRIEEHSHRVGASLDQHHASVVSKVDECRHATLDGQHEIAKDIISKLQPLEESARLLLLHTVISEMDQQ